MGISTYLGSLFSAKRLHNKHISLFAIWDSTTNFSKHTQILRGAKLNHVTVGNYSRIGVNCQLTNVSIGNFSVVAKDSVIGLGQHPTNYLTPHSIFYKKNNWGWHESDWREDIPFQESRRIIIGNDVWIGRHCMIQDGVNIGDGAIIATGSVVTKDVPPYAIVGGIPAKVIRYRFNAEIIKRLLEIRWWDLSDEKITENIDLFHKADPSLEDINNYFK